MSKSKRRSSHFGRRTRFESLEQRIVLDTQIGTVTMPYNGYLSAAVYDTDGQQIRTLLNHVSANAGPVTLTWDGRDDHGRLVYQDGNYSWKAVTSQTNSVEQPGIGDSQFGPLPGGGWMEANDTVDSIAVNAVGGIIGEVGGIIARNDGETSFGDTTLTDLNGAAAGKMDLTTAISGSGLFYYASADHHTTDGNSFIGHYSSDTSDTRREFIGIEIKEAGNETLEARARVFRPNGIGGDAFGAESGWILMPAGETSFSYTYDPNFEGNAGHAGPEGKITLNIFNSNHSYDQTVSVVLDGTTRDSGAFFDSFGIGTPTKANTDDNPAKTAKYFIDDVTYTGNTGLVDFNTNPGWVGNGNTTGGNNYLWSSINSADGSVYQASPGEEGAALRRLAQDGSLIWAGGGFSFSGIAANAKYVFISGKDANGNDIVGRVLARDGSSSPFSSSPTGNLTINSDAFDPRPSGQSGYTPEQVREEYSVWGMAADSRRMFVSNYRKDRVEVYDAVTGSLLGQINGIDKPLGIAVEADGPSSGTIWVANSGNQVTRYTYNSSYVFSAGVSITGLNLPSGVSIGGPSNHLYVTEMGTGKVREYDISSTPTLAGLGATFGSLQTNHTLTDTQFAWNAPWVRWAGLAVDQSGIINVNDDRRIQRYYGTTGGGHTAGDLYQSWWGEFGPAPTDMFNYQADGRYTLVDASYEYEVDPAYTGGPRPGWLGDGTWRVVSRYITDVGVGVRRTLNDSGTPRDYRFVFNGQSTVTAFQIDGSTDRMAAIVGLDNWTGTSRLLTPQDGQFNWIDTDGDGQIDWGGGGTGTSGEVTWTIPLGTKAQANPYVLNGGWVDQSGNVWAVVNKDIVKVPLEGFDAQHNPIYNWAHAVTVVAFQNDDWDFQPRFTRVAANGDIYALGSTKFNGNLDPHGSSGIHGGDWVARYDSNGNRKLLMPIVDSEIGDNTPPAIAFDENDPNSNYFYVGVGEGAFFYIRQYTKDGLLVSRASSADNGIETGWIDHQYGVGAFTQPFSGKTYVFGEDIVYGRSVPFVINGMNTVASQQSNFSWTVPHTPSGDWHFQDNLNDSAGTHTGTFFGGSPTYATGGITGKAIDLDGVDDSVDLPLTNDLAAYTIAGWVKPTDTTNVNIISRGSSTAGSSFYQLRINAGGKFEHTIVDDNISHSVVGITTVLPDTWYYVAIVANNNGTMRLYVNGNEEGFAQSIGTLSPAGDRFRLGASTGAFGNFDGLVDELKVFEVPLSAAEIQTLYGQSGITSVTVVATDPNATEQANSTGTLTVKRSNTTGNLVVNYSMSGSATSGSDYSALAGSVTILNGQTSATVTITPINDAAIDPSESVVLTIAPNANYVLTSPFSATIVITDDEATGDPGWTGVGNQGDGNNYGWSYNTNNAGGAIGEIGGTFARNDNESYYADTNLTQTFTLNDTLTGSGKVTVFGQVNTDGQWNLGHMSSDTADSSTVGIEFLENDAGTFRMRALVWMPGTGGLLSDDLFVPNGDYNFEYTYDPNLGNYGRITARIFNGSFDQTTSSDLAADVRFSGAIFNAFGVGILNRPGAGDAPGKTVQMFIDDAIYTGLKPIVAVSATDASAAELPANTGAFTITRTSNIGALVVNYTVSGTATSGTDYSSLSGSVTIPNGQTSITVTVTPIDDLSPEGNETVILTLAPGSGYVNGALDSATVTILDDDAGSNFVGFGSNPGWSGSNRSTLGNNLGWSSATNQAGGVTGEVGGTFARALSDSYYADTFLSQSFNLNNTISAVGKFDVLGITSGWAGTGDSGLFIGHFSISSTNKEFIGLELKEDAFGLTNQMQVRARLQLPGGGGTAFSAWTTVSTNGNHTFNYSYNPALGANGRLTVNIDAQPSLTVDLGAADRTSGSLFNAFGLGYTSNLSSENAPAKTAQVFLDDVSYSGFRPAVSVVATDSIALEQGVNTGTFTITRTNTSGNLTVNYLVGGTATSVSDYAALPGSVTILDGQTSAVVTVTPVDDGAIEVGETVMLTIVGSSTYYPSTPYQASVTLTDNDALITVSASDANAAEQGSDSGTFTILRNSAVGSLVVNYTLSGTATIGTDYSSISSSVTIPNGQSTVTVVVVPIDDSLGDPNETVILTIAPSVGYTVGASNNAMVIISDNDVNNSVMDFSTNPNWVGVGNTTSGNNYGYSPSTSVAGGAIGEVGGVFARNINESYYADTSLSQTFTLNNKITASGLIDARNAAMDGSWFVGHISQNGADRSAIGIEFKEEDGSQFQFTARIMTPGGTGVVGGFRSTPINGDYHFTYTYDPSLDANGRFTVRIYNNDLSFDKTEVLSLTPAIRTSGATFDSFGMGILQGVVGSDNPGNTIEMYIDDVNYSGHVFAKDTFETGNGSGGMGWNGVWTFGGTATVTSSGTPNAGTFHLQLTGNGASATRAANLSGITSARLVFNWKATTFEAGETAVVEVFDGTNWLNMLTVSDGQDDNVYHPADINIPGAALNSTFQVRIRSLMSSSDDLFYIDDLKIAK